MTEHNDHITVWVCDDCRDHLVSASVEPDTKLWRLLEPGDMLAEGIVLAEHAEDCWGDEPCECDYQTCSRTPCEGCGSWLAGARYGFTVFKR